MFITLGARVKRVISSPCLSLSKYYILYHITYYTIHTIIYVYYFIETRLDLGVQLADNLHSGFFGKPYMFDVKPVASCL